MPAIPPAILKKLYLKNSLRNEEGGFSLALQNTIAPGVILGFKGVTVDGRNVPLEGVTVIQPDGTAVPATGISESSPLLFPAGATVTLKVQGTTLPPGNHQINIRVVVKDVGPLEIPVADRV
ncbi:MAG: hypothetical protein RMK65_02145 [Anaerolineae bacterium]|nr:hypothetical protein [Anaerolineae bacterium]MCX8067428.1 hypothetical protein [Anaerolineae bacterium]MDW7990944.1 hypothetical protein [Anaerolineae bacterium]